MVTYIGMRIVKNERVAAEAIYAAEAGVQHALQALKGQNFDTIVAENVGQPWLIVSNFSETPGLGYRVNVSRTNNSGKVVTGDSIFVTATSVHPSGGKKKVAAEFRNPLASLPINSSMNFVGSFSRVKFSGNSTINGDLPLDETSVEGSECASDKTGISVNSMDVYSEIQLTKNTGDQITGAGLSPSIQLRPSDLSPAMVQNMVNQILDRADRTFIVDRNKVNHGDVVWGTEADPQVTVFTLTATNSRIKFNGDTSGHGILIINSETTKNGRVEFNGNFTWNGLILITGNSGIDRMGSTGTNSIKGAIVLANTVADPTEENFRFRMNGNASIQYSCAAISNAINSLPLILKGWHEISSHRG
ncbi:MAG: hypothetical protein ABGX83_09130 [Nitrospira sp.]|nr:hypothetical protein [Candidatus Manganitrophaceae bacterium]HIL33868.1 hypothetical protein [Candidatus Manganitrophaceae bacterium]